eukprot:gene3620-4509_t
MSEPTTPTLPTGEDGEKSKKALNRELKKQQKAEKKAAHKMSENKATTTTTTPTTTTKSNDSESSSEKTDNYGKLEMNQSKVNSGKASKYTNISQLNASLESKTVLIRGRVHTSRLQGANLCFILVRDSLYTIQAVVAKGFQGNSKNMVKFAGGISSESIVDIEAVVTKSPQPIQSATQKDVELSVSSIFIVSEAGSLPLILEDLSRSSAIIDKQLADVAEIEAKLQSLELTEAERGELEKKKSETAKYVVVTQDKRLDNRVLDLRVPAHQSIFRVQSGVVQLFREHLLTKGFVEIHSPKIISSASESGASVFKLGYFGGNAYLAQSPQFYKQMAICADFDRVFEIGPVFRAENSNTHRHLTEFVGLDLEMTFKEHYHEVLNQLDELMCSIFAGLESKYQKELESINGQYPFEPFKFTYPSPRITFDEAAEMLAKDGHQVIDNDFNTRQEKRLGELVKQKYGVDFFIVDKFHLSVRPFYTMPDPNTPHLANAYDLFMRGEEICSGAQRIHDASVLEANAKKYGVNINEIQSYIDAFKYGCSQHAGGGVGLERVVMLYLGLSNIRKASFCPRDPQRTTP